MIRRLHIVCLDVPWPPDYGGAMDMFYKIRSLSRLEVKIVLHCFEYGRGESIELEKYCEKVYYYPRKKTLPISLPYIVSSRKNDVLLQRLLADNDPILLEGLHCTSYLYHGDLKKKNVWVRLHNMESDYYHNLALNANGFFKKIYFRLESILLKRYENKIAAYTNAFALSRIDQEKFKNLGARRCEYLPLFIDSVQVRGDTGRGGYCLYHGNLSVSENERAVIFLVRDIFSELEIPLIVAGKNPSLRLSRICSKAGVRLIANPDDSALKDLIRNAHIHVLPSFNTTGVKMKLLNALLRGRFVLTNRQGSEGADLESLCEVADMAGEYISCIQRLWSQDFTEAGKSKRQQVLSEGYDPDKNATLLLKWMSETE